MSKTFNVSSVSPSRSSVRTATLKDAVERVLGGAVEACSQVQGSVVAPYGFHPLFEAAHRAYAEHRGLTLSPDNVWLTVSQGFAACVNQDPERYRSCFVDHEGRKEIRIYREGFLMGAADNDWQGCFSEFSARIREHIGEKTHGLVLSDFSTTGELERAASEVVLMDVVQSYFRYSVATLCGITSITLRGTAEDWDKVVAKTRALLEFGGEHLQRWLVAAIPVVEQFARAARDNVDRRFWEGLYKGENGSGGITADGHLLKLLPYVRYRDGSVHENPLLNVGGRSGIGVANLPQGVSCVPFVWEYLGTSYDYQFLAGHVAVSYDSTDNSYAPVVGWAVRPKA